MGVGQGAAAKFFLLGAYIREAFLSPLGREYEGWRKALCVQIVVL